MLGNLFGTFLEVVETLLEILEISKWKKVGGFTNVLCERKQNCITRTHRLMSLGSFL